MSLLTLDVEGAWGPPSRGVGVGGGLTPPPLSSVSPHKSRGRFEKALFHQGQDGETIEDDDLS